VAREATPSAPPEPVRVQSAPKAAVSSETASKPEASPQSQARAGTLVTPDWTGTPVHVVHFSSFTDKARAERHAASLAKELGLPARAVQVDLGARGIWYRTVVGEFASAAEALTFRKDLLDRKTQGVGLVYRMTSKP
jgi:cell division protein FtsN